MKTEGGKVVGYVCGDGAFISSQDMSKYLVKSHALEEYISESKAITEYEREFFTGKELVDPPYNLDRLALTLKANTYHYRCVKQKAADVAGLGWYFVETGMKEGISEKVHLQNKLTLENFFDTCNKRMTFREILDNTWVDYESLGVGYLEVGRNNGTPKFLGHLKGTEMRIHKSGLKYCQVVDSTHFRWFKLFGLQEDIDMDTGEMKKGVPLKQRGNEVIPFISYSPTSKYYGIPDHIPAIPAITASMAAAEFNLDFFLRNAVPQLAVVIEGGTMDTALQTLITEFFKEGVQGRAHQTLVLHSKPDTFGNIPKIRFEKLAVEIRDASFRLYRQDLRDEILTSHGVPPYRIGLAVMGTLGGNISREATEIYKTSIIEPRQEILEHRINSCIIRDGFGIVDWKHRFKDIDVRDRYMESKIIRNLIGWTGAPVLTIDEARKRVEEPPISGGDAIWASKDFHPIVGGTEKSIQVKNEEGKSVADVWLEDNKIRFKSDDAEVSKMIRSEQMKKDGNIITLSEKLRDRGYEI